MCPYHHRIMKSTVTPLWSLKIPVPECRDWSRAPSTSFRFVPERLQAADASARMWRSRLEKQVCVCVWRSQKQDIVLHLFETQEAFSSCLKCWKMSSRKTVCWVKGFGTARWWKPDHTAQSWATETWVSVRPISASVHPFVPCFVLC